MASGAEIGSSPLRVSFLIVVVSCVLQVLPPTVKAQTTTYTFTGSKFTSFSTNGEASSSTCPPECSITGSFTVDQPISNTFFTYIGSGGSTTNIVVTFSFNFTDGVHTVAAGGCSYNFTLTLTCQTGIGFPEEFEIATDNQGNVTGWGVLVCNEVAGGDCLGTFFGWPDPSLSYDISEFTLSGTDFVIAESASAGCWVPSDLKCASPGGLQITTSTLLGGTVGSVYPSQTLAATGGTQPYRWSIISGVLPDGLVLDPATGTISGTPTKNGTFKFTVQVTDEATATATATLSITVGVKVVAAFNGGSQQSTNVTSQPVNAHFPLGSDFTIGLQDSSGKPIDATFSLGAATPDFGLGSNALFPDLVAFQYLSNPPHQASFQSVHNGSVLLTITPDPSSGITAPVSVNVIIENPTSLGASSTVDALIYPLAHQTGYLPEFIKAQIAQESSFNPNSYRYEPLSPYVGDYGAVSRNADFRASSFASYRFATAKDSEDPALPAGTLLNAADKATENGLVTQISSPMPSALQIVLTNPTQNWISQGKTAQANFHKLFTDDFTAQTSLAASYGFLQVMYVTARNHLNWNGITGGLQNPTFLFDTSSNLAKGGGSLNLGVQFIVSAFQEFNGSDSTNPSFTDFNDLVSAFLIPWESFNGSAKYPPKVVARIPSYLPQQVAQIFD